MTAERAGLRQHAKPPIRFADGLLYTANMHDNAANNWRLTAPIAGTYHVDACVDWNANATGAGAVWIQQGRLDFAVSQIAAAPATYRTEQCAGDPIGLAAGEYAEVVVRQSGGVPLGAGSSPASTFLAMTWAGPSSQPVGSARRPDALTRMSATQPARRGSVTTKRVPAPLAEKTSAVPPCD